MWERVFIDESDEVGGDGYEFLNSIHGSAGCRTCHGGGTSTDKEAAHEGVIRDPSADAVEACGGNACHQSIADASQGALHSELTGYHTMISGRAGHPMEDDPALVNGFEEDCNKCHTTCGQCHVSRPTSVKGGFISSHLFEKTPSMINQCTACHGSRVGDEYRGVHKDQIPGYKYDVHYKKNSTLGGKHCVNCHEGPEMHMASGDRRYAATGGPTCEGCHSDVEESNTYHYMHWDDLSCYVCHAQDYKSCNACHPPNGLDEPSYLTFKIGKNPLPDLRDYKYVTLRHVPIVRDTYSGWGYTGGLPNYDSEPTWKYATPHNIQRWTLRTEVEDGGACSDACHNSPPTTEGFFLRQVDLDLLPDEVQANAPYIVPDSPPEDEEWED